MPSMLSSIPLLMILLSLSAAILIFPLPGHMWRTRSTINIVAAVLKVGLVALLYPVVISDSLRPEWSMPFLPGLDLVLRVDPLALFFASLSAVLWLLTTIYAIGYLREKPHNSRFFGFFSLCVTATVGISFSGNLVTFLVFYEMLTLVTFPLVAHWGTKAALKAARTYLAYTLSGGLCLLIGVITLTVYTGSVDFVPGGSVLVNQLADESPLAATVIFILLIAGLGVKAAIVPLHGWLPKAMVAPAPVSALLHAVAVVKAGVFGIVRVVDDVYGVPVAAELGVLTPLVVLVSITIIYGSVQALRHTDIKKRLAYSTVSQVSYVALGITLASFHATTGGVVHLFHQGIMKITLFFCAGLFAEVLGVKTIDKLDGLARRMPWTSVAFTIGGFGMIGLPPMVGFISKWELGLGALDSPHPWVLGVLVTSSLLNAAYFLPLIYRLWFRDPLPDVGTSGPNAGDFSKLRVTEPALLLAPALCTAAAALVLGIGASLPYAPLGIATEIAEEVITW